MNQGVLEWIHGYKTVPAKEKNNRFCAVHWKRLCSVQVGNDVIAGSADSCKVQIIYQARKTDILKGV